MPEFRITTLVDNNVCRAGLKPEHGLSILVESATEHILFDTGQGQALEENGSLLGVDWKKIGHVVLSHGHYDHVGGLANLPALGEHVVLHAHPSVFNAKYSQTNTSNASFIGATAEVCKCVYEKISELRLGKEFQKIGDSILVSSEIPLENDFENPGSHFAVERSAEIVGDDFIDEKVLILRSREGLIVISGCAHRGIINAIGCAMRLTEDGRIRAVIGGMHLIGADEARLNKTVDGFRKFDVKQIFPCHCTGREAVEYMMGKLGDKCRSNSAGTILEF